MERDLDWEKIMFCWQSLPVRSKIKILSIAIRYHVVKRLTALSNFVLALAIEGIVIIALLIIARVFHNNFFSLVAGTAIGIIIGGTFIFWLFKDIHRE